MRRRCGIDLSSHHLRLSQREIVAGDGDDLILAMAGEHLRAVAIVVPGAIARTFTEVDRPPRRRAVRSADRTKQGRRRIIRSRPIRDGGRLGSGFGADELLGQELETGVRGVDDTLAVLVRDLVGDDHAHFLRLA